MKAAIRWMAKNHVAANLLMFVLIAGGIVMAMSVKRMFSMITSRGVLPWISHGARRKRNCMFSVFVDHTFTWS